MWTREMTDLLDVLPYYLLVALPVFIILSPINPVDAASELDVHRLAQFELAGNTHGSKQVLKSKRVDTERRVLVALHWFIAPQSFSGGGLVFKLKLVTMERV